MHRIHPNHLAALAAVLFALVALAYAPPARAQTCTGCTSGTCCLNGSICADDPTAKQCGNLYCGSFGDSCGNLLNCGGCTASGQTCLGSPSNLCCASGSEAHYDSSSGIYTCCTPTAGDPCQGVQCGSVWDGCQYRSCGSCASDAVCTSNRCCTQSCVGFCAGAHLYDTCGQPYACSGSCPSGQRCQHDGACRPNTEPTPVFGALGASGPIGLGVLFAALGWARLSRGRRRDR